MCRLHGLYFERLRAILNPVDGHNLLSLGRRAVREQGIDLCYLGINRGRRRRPATSASVFSSVFSSGADFHRRCTIAVDFDDVGGVRCLSFRYLSGQQR